MNWSTNKSILLSRICVAIFVLLGSRRSISVPTGWSLVYPPARQGVADRAGMNRDATSLQHLRLGAALADVDSAEQHPQE